VFYGITLHRCGQCPHNLCRTNARPPLPGQEKERIEDGKSPRNFPQVMSSPQLWEMNRYKANRIRHKQQERRPE
jgi:hypothetical protein